jgi:RNA polymerase sigma-70 factor (ECF subfamily)
VLVEAAFKEYGQTMVRAMVSFSRDEEAARDGVSQAFTQAFLHRHLLENMPPPAMKAWLYAAARNAVVDIKRRESRYSSFPDENAWAELADERQLDLTDKAAAAALMEKLPPELREPVRLKYFAAMNATEIGQVMNLPPALYYPESADMACLAKIDGEKRAYPDDAFVILGDHDLEAALAMTAGPAKHIWVSGRIKALDRKALEEARAKNLRLGCRSLFIYEGLHSAYGDMFDCSDRILVPDGYEISSDLEGAKLPLYGLRVYVNGDFTMEEKDLPALEALEKIIVKGTATLPSSAVKIFKKIGKADDYFIFEGILRRINGKEQFSHEQLSAMRERGEKLTLSVNGSLIFDDDVTAEDAECIVSLSYNGAVLVSGPAKGVLTSRTKGANGFMGDPETFRAQTGQSPGDPAGLKPEDNDSTINVGTYMLL